MQDIYDELYNLFLSSCESIYGFSQRAGVAPNTVMAMRDKSKALRLETLNKMARALGHIIVRIDGQLVLRKL